MFRQIAVDATSFEKYPKCADYDRDIRAMKFDAHDSRSHTAKITELFFDIKLHHSSHIDTAARRYTALLEAAIAMINASVANKHEATVERQEQRPEAATLSKKDLFKAQDQLQSYQTAIVAIRLRSNAASQNIVNYREQQLKAIATSRTHLSQDGLARICYEVNSKIWIDIGVADHEMGAIAHAAGVRVSNYLNAEINLSPANVREKLDEHLSEPKLQTVWNKFLQTEKDGPRYASNELSQLNLYGGAYILCRIELVASYELRGGIEYIYPVLLLRRQNKKIESTQTVNFREAWDWLMRAITEVRTHIIPPFEDCTRMAIGKFGKFLTGHAFSSRVEELGHELMTTKINLRDKIIRLAHLLNYVMSTEAE